MSIKVEFTQEEMSALVQLIDAGLKSIGIGAAKASVVLMDKLESAAKQGGAPQAVKPVAELDDEAA